MRDTRIQVYFRDIVPWVEVPVRTQVLGNDRHPHLPIELYGALNFAMPDLAISRRQNYRDEQRE